MMHNLLPNGDTLLVHIRPGCILFLCKKLLALATMTIEQANMFGKLSVVAFEYREGPGPCIT